MHVHTLTMSPKSLFTSRYMSSTPSHLSQMPMLLHCTIRLEYWPPSRARIIKETPNNHAAKQHAKQTFENISTHHVLQRAESARGSDTPCSGGESAHSVPHLLECANRTDKTQNRICFPPTKTKKSRGWRALLYCSSSAGVKRPPPLAHTPESVGSFRKTAP